jgi:hypothetical protein
VIRNHSSDPVAPEGIAVHLAKGALKKVHEKSPDAFEIIASQSSEALTPLVSGQPQQFSWKFETDRNCPISDSRASLFLVYGKGDALHQLGQLQLPIHPDPRVEEFLKTFKTQLRFVEKSRRFSSKDRVEVKLAPPSAKEFSMVELLTLYFHFDEEVLEVDYAFQVKVVQAGPVAMDVKRGKKEFSQRFEPSDYRVASGRWNHDRMEAAIRDVIRPLTSGTVF